MKLSTFNLEPDEQLHTLLRYGLRHNNYKLKNFDNPEHLWKYLKKQNKQLILADLSESEPDEERKKVKLGRLTINNRKRSVSVDGQKIVLTPSEFDILHYLYLRLDEVVSAKELLENLWGWGVGESNTVQSHVLNLRKKLGDAKNMLQTVRGFGYCLSLDEPAQNADTNESES